MPKFNDKGEEIDDNGNVIKKKTPEEIAAEKALADKEEAEKAAKEAIQNDDEIKVDKEKKTYTAEEVEAMRDKAYRKGFVTSKQQMYSKLTSAQDKLKALDDEKKALQAKIDSLSASGKGAEATQVEIAELKAKLEIMEKEGGNAMVEVEKLRKENEKAELKSYRTEKIAEAKGEIIPDLVTGSTKAEIDASYILATNRYKEIMTDARKKLNLPSVEDEAKAKKAKEEAENIEVGVVNYKEPKEAKSWEQERRDTITAVYRKNGLKI